MIRSSKKFQDSPIPFPPADQKKNNLTAKCEAALEEVAAQAKPNFVPAEKRSITRAAIPAPKAAVSPEKVAPREVPPPQDDFSSQYADFDEASVASFDSATEHFSQEEASPAPRHNNGEELKAAEERVPVEIRKYLAEQFQVKFNRYIPAKEVRIFSVRGEIDTGETSETTGAEDLDELAAEFED